MSFWKLFIKNGFDAAFAVDEADAGIREIGRKMASCVFGTIDRTVLASRTAETYAQICEATSQICPNMGIDHTIDMVQIFQNLSILFEETYDRIIQAREFLVLFISTRIMY